jgi:hypothetical protein
MFLRNISSDFALVPLLRQPQGKKMFLTGTAFYLLHYGEIFSFRQRVVEVSILWDIAQRQWVFLPTFREDVLSVNVSNE